MSMFKPKNPRWGADDWWAALLAVAYTAFVPLFIAWTYDRLPHAFAWVTATVTIPALVVVWVAMLRWWNYTPRT